MKKILSVISISLSLFFAASSAFAYTVYFEIGDGLNYDKIDGFDLFTNGIDNPLDELTLTLYYQGTTDDRGVDGAIPEKFAGAIDAYDIYLANYGVSATREYATGDIAGWDTNFTSGTVLSLEADIAFTLDSIVLTAVTPSGLYDEDYKVTTTMLADGAVYNVSAVPVPAAVWLLGSGLAGLIALRRKNS